MPADTELWVLFGALHLIGLVLLGMLLVMFLRSETVAPWRPPEDDGGGGGGGSPPARPGPRRRDGGGLPLPDARPAGVRLRGPGRLADDRPRPPRRPAREPGRRAPAAPH